MTDIPRASEVQRLLRARVEDQPLSLVRVRIWVVLVSANGNGSFGGAAQELCVFRTLRRPQQLKLIQRHLRFENQANAGFLLDGDYISLNIPDRRQLTINIAVRLSNSVSKFISCYL